MKKVALLVLDEGKTIGISEPDLQYFRELNIPNLDYDKIVEIDLRNNSKLFLDDDLVAFINKCKNIKFVYICDCEQIFQDLLNKKIIKLLNKYKVNIYVFDKEPCKKINNANNYYYQR